MVQWRWTSPGGPGDVRPLLAEATQLPEPLPAATPPPGRPAGGKRADESARRIVAGLAGARGAEAIARVVARELTRSSDFELIEIVGLPHAGGPRVLAREGALAPARRRTASGLLLAPGLAERRRLDELHREIERVLLGRGLHTVFQPIRHLASQRIVGYEALTRFDDGTPPHRRFTDAAAVDLLERLEEACLTAALEAAADLPEGPWLSVNVSPEVLRSVSVLESSVGRTSRAVVLEITEYVSVDEYEPIREALRQLGGRVRLAVDDVGAGFATLRHILELRPAFVKLDIRFVAGLEADPARQAFIAAMRQAAEATGAELIAEGVETEAELRTLIGLEVQLGQGYLLGRPELASSDLLS